MRDCVTKLYGRLRGRLRSWAQYNEIQSKLLIPPTPSEIKDEAARKRAIFPWVDLFGVAPLSPIQFESEADLFDNSPQDPLRTAVQSPLVWIVNKIIHPACNFRSLTRHCYIRVYPAIGTPLCYFRNRTVSRYTEVVHPSPILLLFQRHQCVCRLGVSEVVTPWWSRNTTGRFSKDNTTSNKNAKACGTDWTRLPVFNFPLCHWPNRFLDLRAPWWLSSPCLCPIRLLCAKADWPSHLLWCLAVAVLILCFHYSGRKLRPWSVLQRVPFLLHELHQRCIKAPSVPGAPRKGLSMYQSDSRGALGNGAWFTHLSRREGTCDL